MNDVDKATIPSNSEKRQPEVKENTAEANKSAGSEDGKDKGGISSKDGKKDSGEKEQEAKGKGSKVEAGVEAKTKDETIRPQFQDAKSSDAAKVSNVD